MCSGIGPQEELERAGVDAKVANGHVGGHMVDVSSRLVMCKVYRAQTTDVWMVD